MDKLSLVIDPKDWGNLVTKYEAHSPRLDSTDFTEGTINLDTDTNGSLSKRKGGPNYNTILLPAAPKDQFEAIFSDGARHLLVVSNGEIRYSSGDTLFNTIVNGTGYSAGANFEFSTTQDRVYGDNGVNSPIVYDRATNYGGVSYSAPRIKTMGVQAPGSAPTAGAPTAGGAVPNGGHTYKVTFLYYDAEESNGSPASALQTAGAGNNTIPLTAIPIGGYGVTARNIYRDNNDGNWVFLHQLADNTTTTYSDALLSSATPTPIPTNNGTPPIFKYISGWLDRLWLSGIPGDPSILYYSEADQPDIFGSENQILCNQEDPITAIIVYFDRLIVFNRRSMGQIIGSTPDSFRYAAIPSSVGCVDNRTLQIHVLHGVPVLIWLSERGFYIFNGNSIDYISEPIENLVNFNIRQAVQQKNANTQTTQAQFQGGTPSNGIDLIDIPGTITTKGYSGGGAFSGTNPRRTWDDQSDWEGGSTNTNTRTKDGDNLLRMPTQFAPASFNDGSQQGTSGDTVLSLATSADFTGHSASGTFFAQPPDSTKFAYSIFPERNGNLKTVNFDMKFSNSLTAMTATYFIVVWDDSSGQPGTEIFTSSLQSTFVPATLTITPVITATVSINQSLNEPLTISNRYWFGVRFVNKPLAVYLANPGTFDGAHPKMFEGGPAWGDMRASGTTAGTGTVSYTFCSTAQSAAGLWTSQVYDSRSSSISPTMFLVQSGSYGSGSFCTGVPDMMAQTIVEGSDLANFAGGAQVTETNVNVNSTLPLGTSGKRYWRLKIALSTSDDRATPTVNLPKLLFSPNATWDSEVIDTTSDSTVFNALTLVSSSSAGTSVTMTIATSANLAGPWSGSGNGDGQFGSFGSVIVRRYVKVRLTFSGNNTDTPVVTSINFTWTLVANLKSSAIDTAIVPPAGWDVFLAQYELNGGTVVFQLSSAPSVPQLGDGGHPFITVNPGDFPTTTAYQFAQWKVIITSSDGAVPTIESITIQWFISSVASIRPASVFIDGRYYVALAQLNQTANDVILELDLNAKWRRLAGLSISTFSFFFNRPYFGLSSSGQIRKFLEGFNDAGTAIELDVRTKAFDFSTQYKDVSEKQKIVGEIIIHAKNTGALLQFFYSVDEGATFYPFYTLSGATSYQTTTAGDDFFLRLKPSWSNGNPIAGRHLMYRIYNNDLFQVNVHSIKAQAMVRKGPPVITG